MELIACNSFLPESKETAVHTGTRCGWYVLSDGENYLGIGYVTDTPEGPAWKLVSGEILPLAKVTHWGHLPPVKMAAGLPEGEGLLDEDGYPTSYATSLLAKWPWSDPLGWLRLAQSIWYRGDYGFHLAKTDDGWQAHVSTLGWSGNESLVRAMRSNSMLWEMVWESSRRGGHHVLQFQDE